jgi:hypothetical protein
VFVFDTQVKSCCIKGRFPNNFQVVIVVYSRTVDAVVNKLGLTKELLGPQKRKKILRSHRRETG